MAQASNASPEGERARATPLPARRAQLQVTVQHHPCLPCTALFLYQVDAHRPLVPVPVLVWYRFCVGVCCARVSAPPARKSPSISLARTRLAVRRASPPPTYTTRTDRRAARLVPVQSSPAAHTQPISDLTLHTASHCIALSCSSRQLAILQRARRVRAIRSSRRRRRISPRQLADSPNLIDARV